MGEWVGGWVEETSPWKVFQSLLVIKRSFFLGEVGGWVDGKVEETKGAGMRVGGWVMGRWRRMRRFE